jgi:hypothetical protein
MNGKPVTVSTATPITLAQWVPTLLRWYPLRHGVVVGASQQAIQLLNAKPETLTLFKADVNHAKPRPPEVNVFDWLIADQNGLTSFYQASLTCESGLQDPQMLKTCWPGIQRVSQQELEARTLDTALQAINPTVAPNWLWVGSLPAATVLIGAEQMLQKADVVAVRVATYAGASVHAGMQSVQTLMAKQGFVLCGIESERNPKIGTALFVKDHAAAQTQKLLLHTVQLQAIQQQIQELVQAKDLEAVGRQAALAELKALQNQHAHLQQANIEKIALVTYQLEAAQKQTAAINKSKDLEAQASREAQSRIKELQKQESELKHAHSQQLAHLAAEIHAEQGQVARLRQAIDGEEQAKKHALAKIAVLEKEQALQIKQMQTVQQEVAVLNHAKDLALKEKQQVLAEINALKNDHIQQRAQFMEQLQEKIKSTQLESRAKEQAQEQYAIAEKKYDTLAARLKLAEEQMLRAEGQIRLINELVLTGDTVNLFPGKGRTHIFDGPEESTEMAEVQMSLSEKYLDENIFERSYTQWQFGDWQSLVKLNEDVIKYHPERAKLALLAAAGHQQMGASANAVLFIRLAQEWGCDLQIIGHFVMAGTYNSLACAGALIGENERATAYFEKAVVLGGTSSDPLIHQARMSCQLKKLI